MKIGFAGAGKVGFSLGRLFAEHGIYVTGYYSRHEESAKEAAEFTKSEHYETLEALVKESDVIFITVPDGSIRTVYEEIRAFDISDKQICHCSGALSAEEAFPAIEQTGASGYSIHPLFPVSSKYDSYRELPDAFFCIEGGMKGPQEQTDSGLPAWKELLEKMCRGVKIIDRTCKVRYHAACAIASNLYCALMLESMQLLEKCGFTPVEARMALSALVRSNLEHILSDGPVKALTGPVERGDVTTVQKHRRMLETDGTPADRNLYLAASRKLVEAAQTKNPDRDYSALWEVLGEHK